MKQSSRKTGEVCYYANLTSSPWCITKWFVNKTNCLFWVNCAFVQVFWPKVVLKKWLNITARDSDFSADEGDNESDFDEDENGKVEDEQRRKYGGSQKETADDPLDGIPYKLRRRNSETFRTQYINTKELRVCVGTWNVGGKIPPDSLDISGWLDTNEPADIYVVGFQEIVPLNAGNIFGAEDNRPVSKWENIIRENLNKIQPEKPKYKCFSDPPSPSRFNPSEDAVSAFDELGPVLDADSDSDEEIPFSTIVEVEHENSPKMERHPFKKFDKLNHFVMENEERTDYESPKVQQKQLLKTLSRSERIGLVWPEQPLDLLSIKTATSTLTSTKSFKSVKSFRTYGSFKVVDERLTALRENLITDTGLDGIELKKKSSPFVRIISKQMVGVFISIWVRRSLRKHIQNLKVSTVGVGAMGYIGNKGSISVSMSIYQTMFCFVCTHLSSGEKEADAIHRNADVQEIHRRTVFSSTAGDGLPKSIYDHERIFWLGDLNYRIDLSYEKTHEFISRKDWSGLSEKDQLTRELRKGRAFDGWSEGRLNFPPTYKYAANSEKYIEDDHKGGRRTPAWCDRILKFGKGTRLLKYKRSEQKLSDHRPVLAIFMAEVEVFNHRKLQKALALTDAEIEHGEVMPDLDFEFRINQINSEEDNTRWDR
ncbi:Type I inositol polyphosphate 5-phosphatase 1 [Rhynchospora pubera]|uniref:Type I inositol polyphosphate 5-phosphatase 1 n=1 Tax=Rhynchospora pubera TaxID=906938 RepID=A0AAV8DH64_9POAL|nr:Type I inositol polyphosphate 5-phosphatase 1 [Rhynchospora pubera]